MKRIVAEAFTLEVLHGIACAEKTPMDTRGKIANLAVPPD